MGSLTDASLFISSERADALSSTQLFQHVLFFPVWLRVGQEENHIGPDLQPQPPSDYAGRSTG